MMKLGSALPAVLDDFRDVIEIFAHATIMCVRVRTPVCKSESEYGNESWRLKEEEIL